MTAPGKDAFGFQMPRTIPAVEKQIGYAPLIIAGPCSLRSEETALHAAEYLKDCGVRFFRGSIFKPRTAPDSFQGLGLKGLPILRRVREELGMGIVTEVLEAGLLEKASPYVDIFQVGSRAMQNFELLKALSRLDKPVILKRGMSATVEEWLQAARYITEGGNRDVILCERGIRTFTDFSRFTLDLNVVPYLRRTTDFPVIVDPSHGTGVRELVAPMSLAAMACGASGLLLEVDPKPDEAPSDGFQTLDLAQFRGLMEMMKRE